jgi:hypothetical protein
VENLWMNGEFPVHEPTRKFFFGQLCETRSPARKMWTRLRTALRLTHFAARVEFNASQPSVSIHIVTAAVHRYQETIGGRSYLIEVKAVSPDRWRAYIVRIPNVPTALMPFYGATPAEAAHQLSVWLTRAYERAERQIPPA